MPPSPLTDEQLRARDTRDVSVALSAGAGCGKTHVLTARFLSHVDPAANNDVDPAKLRQLIAITFTDAAAREMRTRIRNTCYERLQDPKLDDDEQVDWLRLLREIDTARVSTIHAFCTGLLRAHATEAGLDPTFGVLEQSEADVLQYEAIDDVLRARLADQEDDTLELAATFGLSKLKQQLALLLNQRHQPSFDKWLVTKEEQAAKAEELLAVWKQRYDRDAFRLCVQEIADKAPIAEMQRLLTIATPAAGNQKFAAAIAELLLLLPQLAEATITTAELEGVVAAARVQGICKKDDWPTPADFEKYKNVCTKMRDAIKKGEPLPWVENDAREAALLGLTLLRLAHAVADAYQRRKNAQGKLDFADQLSLAHRLITSPANAALRRRLSDDLRLLLVDEFQDTDPLQVELIRTICGDGFDAGRLFFVGDFKQSIYRFRGAAPPEFLSLREQVPESGRLPLTRNFRSQPGVLHFVNALFCDVFHQYEPLQPHRAAATKEPAVEFLWKITPQKNAHGKGNIEAARREEAAAIARRLRELCDENCPERPIVDKETNEARGVRPGDVAILFRALSDVRLYEEALREHGLEYYLVGGHAFYAQQEVFDVLNLLRAVASAADEVSLAGALRSPFFALADESLFWLVDKHGTLNAGLLAEPLPPEFSAEERQKVAAAAATLRHLRAIKDTVPIAALLGEALARTGYDAVLLAEFLGERKLANLQKLLEQARAADQGGVLDLDGFITQLAEFIAQPPKEPLASTSPESADVIRLMTIHRAKGLEFPLVVVPDLDRPPKLTGPAAALDADLGPLVRLPDDDDRDKSATGMSLFAARERGEELEERKRLLYVAITRAADYLILASSLEAHDKPVSDWMELIAERFDLHTGVPIVRLPSGYETPRVQFAPEPTAEQKLVGKSRGPDLIHVIEDARQLAAEGGGTIPIEVAPIPVDRAARQQFSFSRLTGQLVRSDWIRTAGRDPETTAIDPRGLGTLVHAVLERIDFAAKSAAIQHWCEQLAPEHVPLNTEEAAAQACELIERFIRSPRAKQLSQATALHRETEFLLAWPPDRYIQGCIDCIYQDAKGEWHLVDYKTNDVSSAGVARAAQKYEMQMYVYALAAERTLDQPPVELAIHFLRPGTEQTFDWNDTARGRAIELIDQAITEFSTPTSDL